MPPTYIRIRVLPLVVPFHLLVAPGTWVDRLGYPTSLDRYVQLQTTPELKQNR